MRDLAARLADYLGARIGRPAKVSGLDRIPGGASRETYRFVLEDPSAGARKMILRLDPETSLIETHRRIEFAAIRAFMGTEAPVPDALWIEEDVGPLGGAFFVMAEIEGGETSPMKLTQPPFAAHLAETGRQKWTILGAIARRDPQTNGFAALFAPLREDECWRRELDHWERVLDADELEPQPIQRAAIRWMRRNPPPPAQRLSIVHGDYRTGNLLVAPGGRIIGVLDWEMAHLGDPLEDLAWSVNRVWNFARDERAGGMLPKDEAIAIWERASGLAVDRTALRWWELLASLKGQAIWISAAKEFQTGAARDSMMAIAAWMQTNSQDRVTLDLLGRLGPKGA
ncbi:MAG: phosphotransferase family protein [Hyphomicrobiales bacterium]|nr:phosphotransferase family protein [Hyphomicrobiales bacterium]